MNTLVAMVLVVPLTGLVASLLAWRRPHWQAPIAAVASGLHLIAATSLLLTVVRHGIQVAHIGSWPAPYGIVLVVDTLSAVMVWLTALLGLATVLTSAAEDDRRQVELGYHPLLQLLLFGVCGAFITGDLFNLFVFFEVMLMGSFVLLALEGGRSQLEGTVKYVALNLFSSALFLIGAGLAYGLTRTLNMAHLYLALPEVAASHPTATLAMGAFLLLAFGVKAGVFPLYFWLPTSYHTASPAVSALFAGLLTKVGVYALLRLATVLAAAIAPLLEGMLWVAALTMIFGVLGAVAQQHVRRILGFHILSQIGYMVVGVGLLSSDDPTVRALGLAATVFYVAHHILVKTNLYLVAGAARRLIGCEDLASTGGLARRTPWLAAAFVIPAFSLAGLPPLSGFWAKLAVLRAGALASAWPAVIAAAVAGVLTLVSMLKIWNEVFWKDAPAEAVTPQPLSRREWWLRGLPIAVLAAGTLSIGLWPAPLYELAERAAAELGDPAGAVRAVAPQLDGKTISMETQSP